MPTLLWLSVALVAVSIVAADTEAPHTLPVSAPDIYPDAEDQEGSVNVVIVAQAPDADVYFTLDGSDPSRQSKTSFKYQRGFTIVTPGEHVVKAIAIPNENSRDHRVASAIRRQRYVVRATTMQPPSAVPGEGHYKGSVAVQLNFASTLLPEEVGKVELQYVQKDATAKGSAFTTADDSWVKYSAKHSIRIEHVGLHYLFFRTHAANGSSSPAPRYMYYIEAPIVYDVSTECAACPDHETPVAGEWFTVTVQNSNMGSSVFLSYRETCDQQRNIVDATSVKYINRHKTSHRFRTTSAASEVYVCVADIQQPFRAIPRRQSLAKSFRITHPLGDAPIASLAPARDDEAATEAPMRQGNREAGMGFFTLVGLWFLVLVAVLAVLRVARSNSTAGYRRAAGGPTGKEAPDAAGDAKELA